MTFQNLTRKIKSNGVILFLFSLSGRILRFARGFAYQSLIGNPHSFEIGRSPKIIGNKSIHIEKNCRFGDFLWLECIENYYGQSFSPRISIGENVVINNSVHIGAINHISIGKGSLIASNVLITDHSHGKYEGERQSHPHSPPEDRQLYSRGSIVIGENVWIGEYVSILPGAKVGNGVIIGANSTVIGKLPDFTICVGSPAKPIKIFSHQENRWLKISDQSKE